MTNLTTTQRDDFKAALGFWNARETDRAAAIEASDDIMTDAAQTHETLADFQNAQGQGRALATPFGSLQIWTGIQMRRGKARGDLFAMFFDGVAASYFTGEI